MPLPTPTVNSVTLPQTTLPPVVNTSVPITTSVQALPTQYATTSFNTGNVGYGTSSVGQLSTLGLGNTVGQTIPYGTASANPLASAFGATSANPLPVGYGTSSVGALGTQQFGAANSTLVGNPAVTTKF